MKGACWLLGSMLILVWILCSCLPQDRKPEPASAVYTFGPSGLDGAGFQNVVAINPGNPAYVLSGADIAGVQLSMDGGSSTWSRSRAFA